MTASVTTRTMPYADAPMNRYNTNGTPTNLSAMAFRPPPFPHQQQQQHHRNATNGISSPVSDSRVNRRGGNESSLYQNCLALRQRLAEVPGFEPFLEEMDREEQECLEEEIEVDPVSSIWSMLQRGYPLLAIYNAMLPAEPLQVDPAKFVGREDKAGKQATFQFLSVCMKKLHFQPGDCFMVTDLYSEDTNGLVKVLKVVNRVLDMLDEMGLLTSTQAAVGAVDPSAPPKRNHQENVIEELVTTERDYVRHLEALQQFKSHVIQSGMFSGDVIHDIFLNLNALLDHQRRFLIRVEQQKALDAALQNWGNLFFISRDSFAVYEPFIANQIKCNETVIREWEKLRTVLVSPECQGMVSAHTVLTGFLLKPFQRLSKYPLLLDELRKRGNYSPDKIHDLEKGAGAMKAVLERSNSAIEKMKKDQEVQDLLTRVDDWKGHQMEQFGELITYGTHSVLKGDSGKDEREYKIYLFERILLCCKELNPNKPKTKLGTKTTDKKGRPKLQLKGRIFMQNVTDVIGYSRNGHYFLQIFWKGDPGVENFVIKFLNQEIRDKWYHMVEKQRRLFPKSSKESATSQTVFHYMSKTALQNPYQQDDEPDDEPLMHVPTMASSNTTLVEPPSEPSSRHPSNGSLRSRSTTMTNNGGPPGSSGTGRSHPGFAGADGEFMPAPLKLATNLHGAHATPDERMGGGSYFSPTDSPSSQRSFQGAAAYPFPRQTQMAANAWAADGNKHATAPPMGRPPPQPMAENVAHHQPNGFHRAQRPAPSVLAQQHRMRSMSSPDVQNPQDPRKRGVSAGGHAASPPPLEDVPVPPIPPHVAGMRAPVNRAETGSPTYGGRAPSQPAYRAYHPSHPSQQYASHASQPYPQYAHHAPSGSPGPPSATSLSHRVMSPPLQSPPPPAQTHSPPPDSPSQADIAYPSQLKVKVHYAPVPSYVTLVVPIIIKHRSLIDRIDSKMEKAARPSSIAKGTARLRYYDLEGDIITITNDEDVQLAIEEWGMANAESLRDGSIPDFDLYWHEIEGGGLR